MRIRYPLVLLLALFIVGFTSRGATAQIDVSLPVVSGDIGNTESVAVTVGDLTGEDVFSYDFTITYDASIINITGVTTVGTLSEGMQVQPNTTRDGRIQVSASATQPLEGSGALIELQTEYVGDGTTPITWQEFQFNEGNPSANTSGGSATGEDNDAPNASDDQVTTDEDTDVTVNVSANDDDPDSSIDSSTVQVESAPSNGTASANNDGTITYSPADDYHGSDTFTYTVADTEGARSAETAVSVVVGPVNDAPTAPVITSPSDSASVTIEGDPSQALSVDWQAATDAEGDELAYTWQLASSNTFQDVLFAHDTDGETQLSTSYGVIDSLLTVLDVAEGESITVWHRVQVSDGDQVTTSEPMSVTITGGMIVGTNTPDGLKAFALERNHPNPFQRETAISYTLPEPGHVLLQVYDLLGREVTTLADEQQTAGQHAVTFEASDLSAGIYVYRLQAGSRVETRRMVVAR